MAIYIATTKSISRSNGQSAVASASYRAGVKLYDERHRKTQNYSNRDGVMSKDIILPTHLKDKAEISRNELWNMAEQAENRKDSRVAREWIVNLPHELDEQTRKELAHTFAQKLADRYGVIADCCIHQPTQKEIDRGADARNFHAHIMLTTRKAELTKDNKIQLGDKATIELSDSKRRSLGLDRVNKEITEIRELWEQIANEKLLEHGHNLIDSRSYQSQGIDQLPQLKMGKAVTQMERDGVATEIGNINRMIAERNELVFAKELEEIQKTNDLADQIIIKAREANTANKEQTATPKNEFVERLKGTNAPAEAKQKTTPPPPPPAEQKQGFDFKAIRRSQLEKRQAELKQQIDQVAQLKGFATNHDTIKQQPHEIQQEIKQEALKRLSEIEHRATNKCLMSDDIEAYTKAKAILNSVERLEEQQKTLAELTKKQSELTAVSEPKPQSKTQTPLETHSKRLEPQETKQATPVAQQPEKPLQSENRQQNEPLQPSIDIKKAEQTFSDYLKKVEEVAKIILNNQLKALREKAKPILEKYNTLKDSKPLMFGKDQWQKDTDNTLRQYNAMKNTHDNMKDKGVTDDHRTQAKEKIAIDDPELHNEAMKAQKDIEAYRIEQNKRKASQFGADLVALANVRYSGEIIRADDKGILQQTKDGIVYHEYIDPKEVKQGKSYTLSFKETATSIHTRIEPNIEFKPPDKSNEREIQR